MTNSAHHTRHTPSVDDGRHVVVVGLLATPPDHPAQVADRLADDLADILAERVDPQVRWDVRTRWGAVAPRRDGGSEALLDDISQRREDEGWDIAICLTDMPLQVEHVPLVAHVSARRRVGLVSLPALGFGQLRTVRAAVAGLVEGLLEDRPDRRPRDERLARMVEKVAPIHRVVDHVDDGEVGFASSPVMGRLHLVVGMVRDNRPGRALLGLSKMLVGAFGTAAFALTTNTIWQMSDALGGLRLTVIMLLGVVALIAWLIIAHGLWEKPSEHVPAEQARLFNLGTVLTLGLAVTVSYVVLFLGTVATAMLLIDPSVLATTLGRPVGLGDYTILAWLISSLATAGGAVGSGLEDEENVRAAAYGYHPEPDGWRDQQSQPTTDQADGNAVTSAR